MFEVWQLTRRKKGIDCRRLEDRETLEEAISLAGATGPGRYQISDSIGPIMDLKIHISLPALVPLRRF